MHKKVVIIGAGGHAKVITDIVIKSQDILLGFLDDNLEKEHFKTFKKKRVSVHDGYLPTMFFKN